MSEPRFVASGHGAAASPWWGVHVARYRFALSLGLTGTVLDVACGSGFGTGMLVDRGLGAIGMDIEASAVAVTAEVAPCCQGDAGTLPFKTECFDAVCSFETIEHLEDGIGFVGELYRVLRPGGRLVLSTPNAGYTRPIDGVPTNPFHRHEYTACELTQLLSTRFPDVVVLGQAFGNHVRMSPFLDDQQRLPRTLSNRSALLLWRLLNKAPGRIRDGVSRLVWGHSAYLTDADYRFDEEIIGTTPVLMAMAARPSA